MASGQINSSIAAVYGDITETDLHLSMGMLTAVVETVAEVSIS
jgi:hypothetical protein